MKTLKSIFFVLFMLSFPIVGCRSSRSGSSHSDTGIQYLKEARIDSIDFKNRFTRKLTGQDTRLSMQVIEFYPPTAGDTARHGSIKSVTNLGLSSSAKTDSAAGESRLSYSSDTISERLAVDHVEDATYQIKQIPWYRPFIPCLVLSLMAAAVYYFRRK